MANDAVGSSGSFVSPAKSSQKQRKHHKLKVYHEVLRRLKESGCSEALSLSFEEELWAHFNRLPVRYALEVNAERAEDVLTHKKLLSQAHDPANWPVFDVRIVQMPLGDSFGYNSLAERNTYIHPPPTFGSSTNLESLSLGDSSEYSDDEGSVSNAISPFPKHMHEITFSTVDRPKLLSQLTAVLGEIGLNIQEAHVFSTNDGFSLDVFVVVGWYREEIDQFKETVRKEIRKAMKAYLPPEQGTLISEDTQFKDSLSNNIEILTEGAGVWEIDASILEFQSKFASGSCSDLYRGTYCSQDVAIKVFKSEHLSVDIQRDFAQEIYIMRKVRHQNVVQFIGACTKPPMLFIVTEFMSGGSVYDYLHKQKGVFRLSSLLRVAIGVSTGMNYLHQNNIIHRDLKTANLLMDENEVVKVADFGVARIKAQSGIMTAETGTYRWMAPEVIEHRPYDHKADVFSFGIMMWELLTGKLPYDSLTPLQAAVGVVTMELRPTIPKNINPKLAALLEKCWQEDPVLRPDFSEILDTLNRLAKEVPEHSE